jgi:hypothetical protein
MREEFSLLAAAIGLFSCSDSEPVVTAAPIDSGTHGDVFDAAPEVGTPPELVRCVALSPVSLDFGILTIGESKVLEFEVTNCAEPETGDTVVSAEIQLNGDDPAEFFLDYSDEIGIQPGETERFRTRFEPQTSGARAGEVLFGWQSSTLAFDSYLLSGLAELPPRPECPTASPVCRVASTDYEFDDWLVVTAGVVVECSGTQPEGETPATAWEWTVHPPFSEPFFQTGSELIEFVAGEEGDYGVGLMNPGVDGCSSSAGFATVSARPDTGFYIALTWTTPSDPDQDDVGFGAGSDLDLHLVHPNGCWDDLLWDCHFRSPNPDWGQLGPAGNPQLDIEDTDGAGPERIVLPQAEAGTYQVTVHSYNDHGFGESTARLRVSLGPHIIWEGEQSLTQDQWWVVGLNWPSLEITPIELYDGVPPCEGAD